MNEAMRLGRTLGASFFVLGTVSLALPGCGGSDDDTSYEGLAGDACDKAGATGDFEETLEVAGKTRSYVIHIPTEAATKTVALVFAFHGDGGNGKSLRQSLKLEEQTKGEAIVVYPTADGGSFDLEKQGDANADIAFVDALITKLKAEHCITKVFATGFSRGAYFTNHLGCYRGAELAAIAAHGGGGPYSAPYQNGDLQCPSAPTASLVVHGLEDKSVAPSEGQKSIDQWSRTLSCASTSKASEPSPCVIYDGCSKPLEVCKVPGLGHSIWDKGIEKTWSFFKAAP